MSDPYLVTTERAEDKMEPTNIVEDEEGWCKVTRKGGNRSNRRIIGKKPGKEERLGSPPIPAKDAVVEMDIGKDSSDLDPVATVTDPVEMKTDEQRGLHLKLRHSWKVYVHHAESDIWSIESFDNDFFIIDSVGTCLQFIENFSKFDTKRYNFFIMRSLNDGTFIEPTWEHSVNRNGGICSIRIDALHGIELFHQLVLLMVNESLVPAIDVVTGISFGIKTNWALIKVWSSGEDVSKLLPSSIVGGYNNVNIRFKPNIPEY